jgi:hypothetical protein
MVFAHLCVILHAILPVYTRFENYLDYYLPQKCSPFPLSPPEQGQWNKGEPCPIPDNPKHKVVPIIAFVTS